MDRYPRKSSSIHDELVELTEEDADMYEGFLEFIESDSFSEWLEQTIGWRKLHIRKIVRALIQDDIFCPPTQGDCKLPQELYKALSIRLNVLEKQSLLVRARNSADILYLRYPPPVPIREELKATSTDGTTELPVQRLAPLEQRINAAHIATQGLHSHTVNGRMR